MIIRFFKCTSGLPKTNFPKVKGYQIYLHSGRTRWHSLIDGPNANFGRGDAAGTAVRFPLHFYMRVGMLL